jgi:hypothetical protein
MERKPAEEFMVQRLSSVSIDSLDDGVDKETVCGLGYRKNQLFLERLRQDGGRVYETSVAESW